VYKYQICGKLVLSGIKICTDCQCKVLLKGEKLEMKKDYVPSKDNKWFNVFRRKN